MLSALVLGNGESRKELNISSFANDYTLIGCNAIHRDSRVDYLVCCDKRMVEEAIVSENTVTTKIYVRYDWYRYFRKIRKDKRIEQIPELPYTGEAKVDKPIHWGSGPNAILLAATMFDTVILAGFDLYGSNGKINNLYKGTKNYNDKDSKEVDPKFWIYQISQVFKSFPQTDFLIWNKSNWIMPKEWQYPNVRFEEIN